MATVEQREQTPAGRMDVHAVEGGGGLRLHVREWGSRTAAELTRRVRGEQSR
jgi:hypothetical protein